MAGTYGCVAENCPAVLFIELSFVRRIGRYGASMETMDRLRHDAYQGSRQRYAKGVRSLYVV
jgi:hypothetical protein